MMSVSDETPLSGEVRQLAEVQDQCVSPVRHHSEGSVTTCQGTCSMTTLGRSETMCPDMGLISLPDETSLSATQVYRVSLATQSPMSF